MICDWRPFGSKRYHAGWILVVSVIVLTVLSAALAFHATRSLPPWENMLIKHKWDAIPEDWVSLGQPPNDMTIKLHIALKANSESALNDVLLEVSHPRHAKHVLFTDTLKFEVYSHFLQIWDAPITGADC